MDSCGFLSHSSRFQWIPAEFSHSCRNVKGIKKYCSTISTPNHLSTQALLSTLLPKTWPRSRIDHEFWSILHISQSLNILTIIAWYWQDLCESVFFQGIHWLIVTMFSRSGILTIQLRSVCIVNLGNNIDVYSPGTFWGGIIERDDRTGGTFVWWGYLEY